MDQSTDRVPSVRRDGWTEARTTQFLAHLAERGGVGRARPHGGNWREHA
jgi:hypothetical protein